MSEVKTYEGPVPWRRVLAIAMVIAVLVVSLVTTVVSLGQYCLTTHGGDVRELPWRGD